MRPVASRWAWMIGASCVLASTSSLAADHWVSPQGTASGDGSEASPWDLATALAGPAAVQPGDTIWLKGGTYAGTFASELKGTSQAPIIVRQAEGERATIDGGDSQNAGILTGVAAPPATGPEFGAFVLMRTAGPVSDAGTGGSGGAGGAGEAVGRAQGQARAAAVGGRQGVRRGILPAQGSMRAPMRPQARLLQPTTRATAAGVDAARRARRRHKPYSYPC